MAVKVKCSKRFTWGLWQAIPTTVTTTFLNSVGSITEELSLQMTRHSRIMLIDPYSFYTRVGWENACKEHFPRTQYLPGRTRTQTRDLLIPKRSVYHYTTTPLHVPCGFFFFLSLWWFSHKSLLYFINPIQFLWFYVYCKVSIFVLPLLEDPHKLGKS